MIEQIRNEMQRYLHGQLTLKEFESWLIPSTWDLKKEDDLLAYDLLGTLQLALAEHSIGHLDEEELRKEWTLLVSRSSEFIATIGSEPSIVRVQTASASTTESRNLTAVFADISRVTVF